MWENVPFFITEWANGKIGEAIPDADGNHIPIIGQDVLLASRDLDGLVITSFLYHSSWPEECMVLPCPV